MSTPHGPADETPEPGRKNGMATAGMALGITSIIINTFFLVAIVALILASLGWARAARHEYETGVAVGRGQAVTGMVCAVIGIANSLLWKWVLGYVI